MATTLTKEQKKERTTRAAIYAVHVGTPRCFERDCDKHLSEQAAADNMNWLIDTLVACYDNRKRPPSSVIVALGGLKEVAKLAEQAGKLNTANPDESTHLRYEKALKRARNSLLECFGLLKTQGAPSKDARVLVSQMAALLCPPVDDDLESIGEPRCDTKNAAAHELEAKTGIGFKTFLRAWDNFETQFD